MKPANILFPLLIGLLFASTAILPAANSRLNLSAQALAKQLAPTAPAKNFNPADLAGLSKRMIGVIEALEESNQSNGPGPDSLIAKALEFRQDMGDWERLMLSSAALNAWREAHARGMFSEQGKFLGTITKGRGVGDKGVFELIIPGEALPEASNQLANVRLVWEKEQRAPGAPLSARDAAYQGQLAKLIDERTDRTRMAAAEKTGQAQIAKIENGPKTNALGQTAEEHLALWEKDMAAAGETALALPSIRVTGNVEATPSHMTQGRWRVGCEVANLSRHPTEVTVEISLIGITEKKRDHYLMAKSEHKLKLRPSEIVNLDAHTRSEGSYKEKVDKHDQLSKAEKARSSVRFRGFVIRVTHAKGLAAFTGSDQFLAGFADPATLNSPLGSLPAF